MPNFKELQYKIFDNGLFEVKFFTEKLDPAKYNNKFLTL
jgi:hypothetical protein